jgi:hypothetical protein
MRVRATIRIALSVCVLVSGGCSMPSRGATVRRSSSVPPPCTPERLTISGAGALSGPVPAESGHAAGSVDVSNDSSQLCRLSTGLQIIVAIDGQDTRLVVTPDSTVPKYFDLQHKRRIGFKITWPTSRVSGHCMNGVMLHVSVPPAETVIPIMTRKVCGRQVGYSLLLQPPPENPKDPGLLPPERRS